MKKTLSDVILSAAKNLWLALLLRCLRKILSAAKNDISGPLFYGKPCALTFPCPIYA